MNPSSVRRVDDIPAVSNVAFKYADLAIDDAASSPDTLAFLTSGTTEGRERRGRHIVPQPEIYRASALAHLRAMLFPDDRRLAMLAIHPGADAMAESSLARMISWCVEEFGRRANNSWQHRALASIPARRFGFLPTPKQSANRYAFWAPRPRLRRSVPTCASAARNIGSRMAHG